MGGPVFCSVLDRGRRPGTHAEMCDFLRIAQMLAETFRPIKVNEEELAMDAIAEVQPGGHHFGTSHTLARYETAFYQSMLSTRQNFETWEETGSIDTAHRANAIWKALLAGYRQPAMDPAIDEALRDYVERRKREIATTAS